MSGLALLPPVASEGAASTDRIFFALLGASGLVIVLVVGLVVVFSVRYRRGSPAKRGRLPEFFSRDVEVGWTSATLFAFLFLFWWAGSMQLSALVPPRGAMEVHVVAKQWMWKLEHPNGAREINELHVPLAEPVKLVMTSQDVIHSFFVPAFRMKQDVLPGRYTETWFKATKEGTFHLLCAEYCGTDHSRMTGKVVVMRATDYARWARAQPQGDDLDREGAALFLSLGCSGCHAAGSTVHAPSLAGIYGGPVQLSDGRSVTADDAYLRDSILQPRRDIVAGYDPVMPSFASQIDDGQIVALVAYIRSLKDAGAATP